MYFDKLQEFSVKIVEIESEDFQSSRKRRCVDERTKRAECHLHKGGGLRKGGYESTGSDGDREQSLGEHQGDVKKDDRLLSRLNTE